MKDSNDGRTASDNQHSIGHIVVLDLPNGDRVSFTYQTLEMLRYAGLLNSALYLRSNDDVHFYLSVMSLTPEGTRICHAVARLVEASIMLLVERSGGKRALDKGWVVKTINGKPLDLRDDNIAVVPAAGSRNSYNAVWELRERLKLADKGEDPNTVFAERRRAKRIERRNKSADRHDVELGGRVSPKSPVPPRSAVPAPSPLRSRKRKRT